MFDMEIYICAGVVYVGNGINPTLFKWTQKKKWNDDGGSGNNPLKFETKKQIL
jgi:hypothetical protein